MKLRLTRRILGWWPKEGEERPAYALARKAESLWRKVKTPPWDEASASLWWRCAGRLARLD